MILFFNIYNAIKQLKSSPIDVDAVLEGKSTSSGHDTAAIEQETQTELHPVPFLKDETYIWNLWDLRRKVIDLANLRRKRTTSAQTTLSYYRLDMDSQRYDLDEKELQTVKEEKN